MKVTAAKIIMRSLIVSQTSIERLGLKSAALQIAMRVGFAPIENRVESVLDVRDVKFRRCSERVRYPVNQLTDLESSGGGPGEDYAISFPGEMRTLGRVKCIERNIGRKGK
jgi:hypothetical protein